MAIRFRCQSCSGLMSISNRQAGAMVQCPTCGDQTPVPLEDIFEAQVQQAVPTEPEPEPTPDASVEVPVYGRDEAGATDESEGDESPDDADASEESDEAPALQLRRRRGADEDMDLTPMVDVTFQLLIFFMVTASFALQKSIEVPAPDPDKKGAAQQLQILEDLEGTSIRVQIDAANVILIDDEPLADPERLAEALKDKMRKEQKTEVLISAHAASLHRSVIAVIDAANAVGMQKIRLVSRQGKSE